VIKVERNFAAVAVEGFSGIISAGPDLIITVLESAASRTDGEVRVWPEALHESQVGIQVGWRHRQTQRLVCPQKIQLVAIIIRVAGKRSVPFQRLVIAELDKIA